MKTIEEMKREAREKKVEITKLDFMEKAAKVTSGEPFDEMIGAKPHMIMVFAIFVSNLADEIFNKEEE